MGVDIETLVGQLELMKLFSKAAKDLVDYAELEEKGSAMQGRMLAFAQEYVDEGNHVHRDILALLQDVRPGSDVKTLA